MVGGTENRGHPWDGEVMTMRIDDSKSPVNGVF